MDENYEELFQRIRAKCRQQRWHGPDGSNPFEIVKQERIRQEKELERIRQSVQNGRTFVIRSSSTWYWYDRNRKQYAINLDTDLDNFPLQTDFEYPNLTEEEMAAIEHNRRYPFPPLLRALYTTVANGGFGPGYGLTTLSTPAPIADGSSRKRHERSYKIRCFWMIILIPLQMMRFYPSRSCFFCSRFCFMHQEKGRSFHVLSLDVQYLQAPISLRIADRLPDDTMSFFSIEHCTLQ